MAQRMNRMSALARTLDPRLRSNQIAVGATVLAGAVGLGWSFAREGDPVDAFVAGVLAGGAVFLAWAITREIAPDEVHAATLAMLLATLVLFVGFPSLGAAVALLLVSRVVVRSTGLAPHPADVLVMIVVAGWTALTPAAWPAGLAIAAALALDVRLPGVSTEGANAVSRRSALLGAGLAAVAALIVAVVVGTLTGDWATPTWPELALVLAGLVGGLASVLVAADGRSLRSRADVTSEPLRAERVRAARALVLIALVLSVAVGGGEVVSTFGPAIAALIVAGAWGVARGLRRDSSVERQG